MAELTSRGVHTPVALPYLVAEGLLPENASTDLYHWETYASDGNNGNVEEELFATKACVVWSRGGVIRNVYRFDLENEGVTQAVLTSFPPASAPDSRHAKGSMQDASVGKVNRGYGTPNWRSTTESQPASSSLERAVVVLLKSKAHIYFLKGPSHIVDLPFEVARAFAAPRGLLLQRKDASPPSLPPTPQVPAPPPNSFFSSQIQPSSSYLQSPILAKSFGGSQPVQPSLLGASARLEALFQNVFGTTDASADGETASLYALTAPLSDLSVVTYSLQQHRTRTSSKASSGLRVEFEALDPAEQIIYVSASDELGNDVRSGHGSLTLLVTSNSQLRSLTVWHAWYIDEQSLAALLRQRTAAKAAKAKRRSSFMSANVATGTTTPAVRAREGVRESFATAGSLRLPSDAGPGATMNSSRKPTRQEEEDEMAHQMDPDFQPTVSQQAARENRRISSLNADVRAGQHNAGTSFGGGARRNTSFGGPGERKSLGHRRSRGSTPCSVFSRSLGPEDDLMELDISFDVDNDESIESIVRHVRATQEAAAADGILGGTDEGFKRELVVQKIHSITMPLAVSSSNQIAAPYQVLTLRDPLPSQTSDIQRLGVYVRDGASRELTCVQLIVRQRKLWPKVQESANIAVPVLAAETKLGQCDDLIQLKDGNVRALLSDKGIILSPSVSVPCPLDTGAPYRARERLSLSLTGTGNDQDVGRNRVLRGPDAKPMGRTHAGAHGQYDEVANDGLRHRRQLTLVPNDEIVNGLLQVCQLVLPARAAQMISGVWMLAHAQVLKQPFLLQATNTNAEWVAFATACFVLIGYLVDQRARAGLNLSKIAGGKSTGSLSSAALDYKALLSEQCKLGPWRRLSCQHQQSIVGLPHSPLGPSKSDRRDQCLPIAAQLADEMVHTIRWLTSSGSLDLSPSEASTLMLALHVFAEEQKLNVLTASTSAGAQLAALTAQLGSLLGLEAWTFAEGGYLHLEGANEARWAFVKSAARAPPQLPLMDHPVGVYTWFEYAMKHRSTERYPSIADIASMSAGTHSFYDLTSAATILTSRIVSLSDMLDVTSSFTVRPTETVELMQKHHITSDVLETLPEAIAAPFREAIARCEREPPTSWPHGLLRLVGRDDIDLQKPISSPPPAKMQTSITTTSRDVQTICSALEQQPHSAKTKEASRHAVSQLIFSEDRRLVEATSLMHYNSPQVAECPKQPDWSDAHHFEQQRRVLQWITMRMIALPPGDGMLHFDSQTPLLTEKYHLSGFSNACVMQPMGHTLTADRSGLTEEKVNWAYFHAGVSAGLRITKSAKGIDTSWIAFNKPYDLTNRHAGLLLALGLRGHLRHLAKWLSFKYLTPKHTVTSVGLLLGLSASYMGTMDGLITRMLSVHITRMLPPGAAELNVSPITQTAGLMGIGLLYYNTQHRRMSEIMLSEVEHMELEDPDCGPDPLRDESYRLAAGFALGFINLGKGKDLRGLNGMYLPERLLAVSVGSRPVSAVHVFDRATAGAIMGIALVYMKSNDRSIARKVDIPDTEAQFDHVRPDMLMLRAMAKHLILWEGIATAASKDGLPYFTQKNVPSCYHNRFKDSGAAKVSLKSSDVPFFNIVTGLVLALSLKYAGSRDETARDEILLVLDYFYRAKSGSDASFYYDAKLTRATVRRCIDVVALAAATVMAGTGDLKTFRYLRRLHGRTDSETPYGSHLAAHLAIGVLFLGGGTFTFATSDLAVASLLCAFYPLFPTDVHDNHVHLQAFRHLWVFAAEARCLVVEDIDTQRPIPMPIEVTMRDGSVRHLTSPCLLPELNTVASVHTADPSYWRVTLDFERNPKHLAHFQENQRISVRRCPPSEAHNSIFSAIFSATAAAQHDVQLSPRQATQSWRRIFDLPSFKDIDKAETELILPPNPQSSVYSDERGTSVDHQLVLAQAAAGDDRNALWDLRMLFAWAEKAREDGDGRVKWIRDDVLDTLKARIEERMQGGIVTE